MLQCFSICKFNILKASRRRRRHHWEDVETFSLRYIERSNHNHYNSLQSRWKMSLEHHFASFFPSRCCHHLLVSFHPSIHLLSFFTIKWIFKDFIIIASFLFAGWMVGSKCRKENRLRRMWWQWKWEKLMDWRKRVKKKKKSRLNDVLIEFSAIVGQKNCHCGTFTKIF